MIAKTWLPLLTQAAIARAVTGIGPLAFTPRAEAQTPAENKAIVQASFDA